LETYRLWQVETWSLTGPRASWREQLARRQREHPVFALVGGLPPPAPDSWRPIHDFCEAEERPCLFPETELPPPEPGRYHPSWSRGLALEADALARHLEHPGSGATSGAPPRIVQVYRAATPGEVAATAFREAWGDTVESLRWEGGPPEWERVAAQHAGRPQP